MNLQRFSQHLPSTVAYLAAKTNLLPLAISLAVKNNNVEEENNNKENWTSCTAALHDGLSSLSDDRLDDAVAAFNDATEGQDTAFKQEAFDRVLRPLCPGGDDQQRATLLLDRLGLYLENTTTSHDEEEVSS